MDRDVDRQLSHGLDGLTTDPVKKIGGRPLIALYHFLSHGEDRREVFAVFENRASCVSRDRAIELNPLATDHPGVSIPADLDGLEEFPRQPVERNQHAQRPLKCLA